jgi:CheY-like chemotaxis protein
MARILLVEDNPLNAKLASLILAQDGHQIEVAADAIEAERALKERVPDLILMDLGLPGKDGYTLTREIRKDPTTHDIPVLAVTSFAMKGDERRAMEAGCSGYLTKPIDRSRMLHAVHELLARRSTAEAAGGST